MSEMYTERLLDHYRQPRHRGRFEPGKLPGLEGEVLSAEEYNPLCGDRIEIQVRIHQDRVAEIRWDGRGCALCLGAASLLTESVQERSLSELAGYGQDAYLAELQSSIRPARLKCALLPWMALRHALFDETEWPLLET
jgi:nitrogen fixation NifU-like protein